MPVLKRKLSKSAWVLIGLLVIVIIALPILHFTGVIDLSFIGDGFIGIQIWSSESVLNAVLLDLGLFALGMLFFYAVKTYIFGTQIPPVGVYQPIGQTVSQPQQPKEETVVSE